MGDCMSKSKDSAVLKHFFKNVIFNVVPLEEAGLEAVPLNCQLLSYMQHSVTNSKTKVFWNTNVPFLYLDWKDHQLKAG